MFNQNIFSERLLLIRQSKSIMAKDIASALNISKAALSQFENALTLPSMPTLVALADYLDVSIDYLVGRSDDPTRH